MIASDPSKPCAVCGVEFVRRNTMQVVCGIKCARQVPVIAKRNERAQNKSRREALKTRQEWLCDAQVEFNRYVRLRDQHQPCICCGSWGSDAGSSGGDWDAGHYRSTGSAPHMRFDESNCHRQLKQCNRWGAGRAVDYRIGLIERVGLPEVERIEADQTLRKWTIPELQEIRARYREKAKALESSE
jgi:hypothetical protein